MVAQRRRRVRRRQRPIARPMYLQDRSNPLEGLSDNDVFSRFRFRPDSIIFLTGLIANSVERATGRSSPLPPLLQLLATLRFLATGSFYSLVANSFSFTVSTSSVCRAVHSVCTVLASLAGQFIKVPTGPEAEETKRRFFSIAGFPNVLGCVDGTLITIQAPHQNEGEYLSRKKGHALNVQMVCDAEMRFINCVAKWPGSVHDSRILKDSRINLAFENGTHKGFLLGDSGYPCRPHIMTPFLEPANRSQEKFNRSHMRTRVLIEQSFGILKRRFACLHSGLRVEPNQACKIIVACAVLHNIGITRRDIVKPQFDDLPDNDDHVFQRNDDLTGTNIRDLLCANVFS